MLVLQVLFDVVPDIKLAEALELVTLQPTGTSAEAYRQRLYLHLCSYIFKMACVERKCNNICEMGFFLAAS